MQEIDFEEVWDSDSSDDYYELNVVDESECCYTEDSDICEMKDM